MIQELLTDNKIELLSWDICQGCVINSLDDPLVEGAKLVPNDGITRLTPVGYLDREPYQRIRITNDIFPVPDQNLKEEG